MENPYAPQKDEALVVTHYKRTPQQAAMLGIEVTWRRCAPFCPAVPSPSLVVWWQLSACATWPGHALRTDLPLIACETSN